MATRVTFTNMTSTEVYKTILESTIGRLRYYNNPTDANAQFAPTSLGGAFGQREILEGQNIMRKTKVT